MFYAWANYGDCYFESMEITEIIDWLELEEDEIKDLENAIQKGKTDISFGGGSGVEW